MDQLVLVKWLIWLGLILLIQIHGNNCCFEEERLALLQFKASLQSLDWTYDADELPSWVDDDPKSDCCKWERVTCNFTTGHVIQLSLNSTSQSDSFSYHCYDDDKVWFLNISIFQPIKELRSLDLSSNEIGSSIHNNGFEKLSSLKNLKVLNLGKNCFNKSILSSVAAVTSLETLILEDLGMEGSFLSQDFKILSKLSKLKHLDLSWNPFNNDILNSLSTFSSLERLDLSYNRLQGTLFTQGIDKLNNLTAFILRSNQLDGTLEMQKFSAFKSLEILDLRENEFTGCIPEQMWAPPYLKALSLSGNNFNCSLPNQSFRGLEKLEELDLSNNNFGGSLPISLYNLTFVRFLDLSQNQFTGNISAAWLASLKSLEYIDLSYNQFQGSFSINLFANHSSLEVIRLRDNKIEVETRKYSGLVPSFQLKVLVLQNCRLDSLDFLFHQSILKVVDLSHNKINGRFPNWLFENNTGLEYLSLENNSFNGQIQEIRGNNKFDNLRYLNLASNSFQGDFPFSAGDNCKLESLDLSSNNFSGEISEKLFSSCTSLERLKLSHNNFHGEILTGRLNLTGLYSLELNDNQFVGTLSSLATMPNTNRLNILDVSNNYFNGEIRRWMENFTFCSVLIMHGNLFDGQISCQLLSGNLVDLSHNSFSGPLPSCSFPTLKSVERRIHLNLQGNRFTGSIPEAFLSSTLYTLDLRDNNLSGYIPYPNTFGEFGPMLQVLLLGGNRLNGSIPNWLCQLNDITLLDLSRNSFSGFIPHCLHNLSFGRDGGEFNGPFEIASGTIFQISTVYNGSLMGNGEILGWNIDTINVKQKVEFVTKHRANTYQGDIISFMSGLDLSHNNLTGEIPFELAKLSQIHALNLSHNQLIGSIPTSFSNLTQLESLDLSHNHLSGQIPSDLIGLHFLAVFSVAYNNLSGTAPDMKGQFSTFDSSSYEGNPFLCGPQLEKSCNNGDNESPTSPMELPHEVDDGKWYEIDQLVFFASFSVSFAMFFLGVITLLYINPYWRQRLFYHCEKFMFSCYYFVYDPFSKFFVYLYH
uniref:LRR-RLK n=1 Tax=Vernicia montana TaxID=316732 RepID=A0A140G4P0_9ROSI|nr:LRR-RLK [Vernicia montana]